MMLNQKIGYIQGLISAVFTFLQGPFSNLWRPFLRDHLNSVPGITVLLFIRFSFQSFLIEVLAKLKAAAIKQWVKKKIIANLRSFKVFLWILRVGSTPGTQGWASAASWSSWPQARSCTWQRSWHCTAASSLYPFRQSSPSVVRNTSYLYCLL